MKNNRCGLYVGRGHPRQRSGSRGDPPLIFKIRDDLAAILENRFRSNKTSRMELAEVRISAHRNGVQGRGMSGGQHGFVKYQSP